MRSIHKAQYKSQQSEERARKLQPLEASVIKPQVRPTSSHQDLCRLFLKFISVGSLPFYTTSTPRIAYYFAMGTGKKEANRKIRQGKVGDGMANVKVKGENFYRYVRSYLLLLRR